MGHLQGEGSARDALLSRVVDGESSAADWSRLRRLAERDRHVWRDLVAWQSDRDALSEAVVAAGALADRVETPLPDVPDLREEIPSRGSYRFASAGTMLGWGAAAAMAAAWAIASFVPLAGLTNWTDHGVEMVPISGGDLSLDEILDMYVTQGMEEGRVVRELPEQTVISATPTEDGSALEVLYLRQILERKVVGRVVRYERDEFNRPVPVAEPASNIFQRTSYTPR